MTAIDDDILMRRVDGELSPDEAERVDLAARTDPGVAARLESLRRLREVTREAFPIGVDPRDRALKALIASEGVRKPSPLAALGAVLAEAFAPRRVAIWGGLAAAAFVAGVLIGPGMAGDGDGFSVRADGTLAEAGLIRVLDTRLTSDGADADGRSVALTFRDDQGRWCRTFEAAEAGVAGLACRQDDGWAMRALAPIDRPAGEIRTASAETPAAVLAAVDATITGETLDAADEARARDAGWR